MPHQRVQRDADVPLAVAHQGEFARRQLYRHGPQPARRYCGGDDVLGDDRRAGPRLDRLAHRLVAGQDEEHPQIVEGQALVAGQILQHGARAGARLAHDP